VSTTLPVEGYVIDISDGRNWVLQRPVVRKNRTTAEEYEGQDVVGYYGTLQSACKALFREQLGNAGPTTIPKLTKYVEEAENRIVAAITALQEKGEITWPIRLSTTTAEESGSKANGPGPTPTTRSSSAPRTPRQNSRQSRSQPVSRRSRRAGA